MGVVYEALDKLRDRTIALKTLSHVDANSIYRIKNEFRALSDVSHPNLVDLYELAAESGYWFFTMEKIEGKSFLERLRPGADSSGSSPARHASKDNTIITSQANTRPLSDTWIRKLRDAAQSSAATKASPPQRSGLPTPAEPQSLDEPLLRETLRQLARGMGALHDAGKLHRDIKPSNVLITPVGRVVLLDFGLATELEEQKLLRSTLDGQVCGTVAYMSPEQALCDALTPASDWYSVGVMLFEVLTGQLPFEGPMFKVLTDKQQFEPPDPNALASELPQDLVALCAALMQRDPKARPTGADVLSQLGAPKKVPLTPVLGWQDPSGDLPLIGRETELERLLEACQHNAVSIVTGPVGIGKSAVLRRFCQLISGGALVLTGRCYERESVPYKAIDSLIDALASYLRKLPVPKLKELVSPQIHHLARLFPVLLRIDGLRRIRKPTNPEGPLRSKHKLAFDALEALLDRMGEERPLVLALEDLHWGDEESGRLLARLMNGVDPGRRLLAGSCRAQEGPLLAQLNVLDPSYIELGPLEPNAAARLARIVLERRRDRSEEPQAPLEARIKAIAKESDGTPLFVLEMAGYAISELPTPSMNTPDELQLEAVLKERFRTLSAPAARLLELTCIADMPVHLSVANLAAKLPKRDRAAAVELRAQGLIHDFTEETGELIEVTHERVRKAVLRALTPEEQAVLRAKLLEMSLRS